MFLRLNHIAMSLINNGMIVDDSDCRYELDPVVVFGVLDHWNRRPTGSDVVLGVLIGEVVESPRNQVLVKYSIAIPHTSQTLPKGSLSHRMEVDAVRKMVTLALKADSDSSDMIVGWYTSGKTISHSVSLNHRLCPALPSGMFPLALAVDTELTGDSVSVSGFNGKFLGVQPKPIIAAVFEPVSLEWVSDPETITLLESLIRGRPEKADVFDSPASWLTDSEATDLALADLEESLGVLKKFVDNVSKGEIQPDENISAAVIGIMDKISRKQAFSEESVQDLLMVVYLANLVKAHASVADRLNVLV